MKAGIIPAIVIPKTTIDVSRDPLPDLQERRLSKTGVVLELDIAGVALLDAEGRIIVRSEVDYVHVVLHPGDILTVGSWQIEHR